VVATAIRSKDNHVRLPGDPGIYHRTPFALTRNRDLFTPWRGCSPQHFVDTPHSLHPWLRGPSPTPPVLLLHPQSINPGKYPDGEYSKTVGSDDLWHSFPLFCKRKKTHAAYMIRACASPRNWPPNTVPLQFWRPRDCPLHRRISRRNKTVEKPDDL
jgi:hypothetical protein